MFNVILATKFDLSTYYLHCEILFVSDSKQHNLENL